MLIAITQYGYAAFVDADDTLQYAVILAYEVGSRLDSPRAKLLFTDGTTKKVDVKALKKADGTAYSGTSLADYASANSDLNKYDVVSYTVNSDEEYTLTLAADARDAVVGSAKITKGIPSLAGTVSGNWYNVGATNGGERKRSECRRCRCSRPCSHHRRHRAWCRSSQRSWW